MPGHSLAVCGWDDTVPGLIEALDIHGLRAVRIADHSGAALVRARHATGLPCVLRPATALRHVPLDAVLLAAPGHAAAAVHVARSHAALLLVTPETLDAESLRLVADAAIEDGLSLAVIRPAYRASGLRSVEAAARGASLLSIALELAGPSPRAGLAAATAAALRMLPGAPASVVASTWGSPTARGGIALAIRTVGGALATADIRRADVMSLRVTAEAVAGPLSLRRPHGLRGESDALHQEVRTAALVTAQDLRVATLLRAEAAVLLAVEAAIETGQAVAVEPVRTQMRLVPASHSRTAATPTAEARSPRLRLVVS